MPKNKKNKNNTTAKIIGIILLILLAFAGGFFIAQRFTGNNNEEKPENNQTRDEKPNVIIDVDNNENNVITKPEDIDDGDKTPVKYDGDDPNTLDSLTGSITYTGVTGNKLIIRMSINQYLGSGVCSLTLGDYSSTVNITPSASTSTCEGFDIPISDLGNLSGKVNFTINLQSGDKTGTITGEVSL